MLPNREGLFHAYPVDVGVGETRENKLLQVAICYHLFEELASGEWVDCSADNFEITGYHILEKRDHALNQTTIEALKAALGWDGRDPFWLQDNAAELMQKPVQVKIGFEEYNGNTSPRVQFLNPYGSKPAGVTKGGDDLRRNVINRLGAKFRALAGGTPANDIAKWDGMSWSALGSGMNGSVRALTWPGDGGRTALYVARSILTNRPLRATLCAQKRPRSRSPSAHGTGAARRCCPHDALCVAIPRQIPQSQHATALWIVKPQNRLL